MQIRRYADAQICRYADTQISGYLGLLVRRLISQREQTRLMSRDCDSIPQNWDLKRLNEVTWVAFFGPDANDIINVERGDRYAMQTDDGTVTVKIVKVGEDRCVLRAASSGWSMFDKNRC